MVLARLARIKNARRGNSKEAIVRAQIRLEISAEEHEEVGETAQRVTIALKPPRARVQAACRCPDRCERSDLSDQPASRLVVGIANAQRATDIFCAMREHANAHDAKRDRAGRLDWPVLLRSAGSLIVRMETGRGHGGTAGARKPFG